MSVLIQGMTIDELWEYGEYCQAFIGTGQAIEIPPHGRLIDADELTGCLATLLQFPSNLVNGQWIVNTIREQPTIIPGDKED